MNHMKLIKLTVFMFLFHGFSANAQIEIWTGTDTIFEKINFADYTLDSNQDRIVDSIWITRKDNKSIFNIAKESDPVGTSPLGTLWAFGTSSNLKNLTFTTWNTTHGNKPLSTIGKNMVLFIPKDSIYIDIIWQSFSSSNKGGGFSYKRATNKFKTIVKSISVESCNSYITPSGNNILTITGNYSDTIFGLDADTVFEINFTNKGNDPSFDVIGNKFIAKTKNAAYQWMDCENNYITISDAIDSIYITGTIGRFALEVTKNGCVDTSGCYDHSSVSIGSIDPERGIIIYPNPSNQSLTVNFPNTHSTGIFQLINSIGSIVMERSFSNISELQVDLNQSSGQYFCKIIFETREILIRNILILD